MQNTTSVHELSKMLSYQIGQLERVSDIIAELNKEITYADFQTDPNERGRASLFERTSPLGEK